MLKLPPWKVKKAQAQSRGWSIDGLQQAIGVAAELNADVKGAAASADYALERAVRRIVAIRSETGRRPGVRRPLTARNGPETRRAPSREGRGLVHVRARGAGAGSEAGDLLGQTRLAVGGLVLVDDALAGGLVQLPWRRPGRRWLAAAASPASAAARTRRTAVFRADLTATLR